MLSRFSHFVLYGHCIDAGAQCEKYIILLLPFYLDIFRKFDRLRKRQSKRQKLIWKIFPNWGFYRFFTLWDQNNKVTMTTVSVCICNNTTHGEGRNKGISEEATVWKHDQFTLTINFVKPTLWCTKNVAFSRNFFKFS